MRYKHVGISKCTYYKCKTLRRALIQWTLGIRELKRDALACASFMTPAITVRVCY